MAGRRTNLALFVALAAALVSGGLAFGIGTGWNPWVTVSHAVFGIAVLVLAPWKSVIARRGLRRSRRGTASSLLFSFLVVVSLVSGLLHASGIAVSWGPLTAMQVHVGSALLALPLGIYHVVARRQRPRRSDVNRRVVLRAGAVLGGAAASYYVVEGLVRVAGLAGGDRRFTGSHERGSHQPEDMPVTQWLNDAVPEIDASSWSLSVGHRSYSYDELSAFDDRVSATLDCTGGWFATQEWAGVRLDRLLEEAGDARSIAVGSVTGYGRRFPLADASRILIATRIEGRSLSAGHGYPARIVAAGRRGFWWVKWVTSIEASDVPWWRQSPFPLT